MIVKNICPECFKEKGEYDICPHCGFSSENDHRELFHLPLGAVLEKRYIIGRVIGFGGFGITYKAWDNELGMVVAIKEYYQGGLCTRTPGTNEVIVFSGKDDKEDAYRSGLERFLYEAQNTAKFREHPYIVDVYNYFSANNTAYIVMEFLDGVGLDKYIKMAGGKLNYEDTITIMEPVMRAIEELHSKNILHRDISPDNIFITIDNRIKVIDFGAARFSNKDNESTLTAVLKPGYAPPEQYSSKGKQGAYTDVYALGATIYKTVTGTLPDESVDRQRKDEVKKPSEMGAELPLNAEKAIMKAMALKPGLRFQKVSDMRLAFMDKKEIDFPEIELKKRKKKRAIITGIAAAAMLMVVVIAVMLNEFITIEADKIKADTINMWVPSGEEYTTDEFDDVTMGFTSIEGNEKFTVNIVEVPSDEYEQKLVEAYGTNDFPDVFRGDLLSDETKAMVAAPVDLYYTYFKFNMDQYHLIGENSDMLKEEMVIPISVKVPVLYANLGLLAKIGEEAPEDICGISGFEYDIQRLEEDRLIDAFVTGAEDIVPYVAKTFSENAEDIEKILGSNAGKNGYDVFAENRAVFYLGWTNDLSKMQDEDKLRGSYTVVPLYGEKVCVEWGACYSISNNSSLNRQRLAMLYLSYLSTSGSSYGLPLDKEEFKNYVDSNAYFIGFVNSEDSEGNPYWGKFELIN
ncbi:MAG: protein kinase [Oscillospiraceae bacterium]|nr:protein kinase [Oscillospiraceae bacterium]